MSHRELMGDLEVDLATVPFGVVAKMSVSYEHRVVERCSEEMTGDT